MTPKGEHLDNALVELDRAIKFGRRSAIIYWASRLSVAASEYAHQFIREEARALQIEEDNTL